MTYVGRVKIPQIKFKHVVKQVQLKLLCES